MKKIIISIFLGALTLGTVTSCRDAIDIIQDGEMSNDVTFQTLADVRMYLVGNIYSNVDVANEIAFTSRFTDEAAQGNFNTELSFGTHQFFIDTDNGYASGIWIENNTIINRVNRMLEGVKSYTPSASEQAQSNSYLAEARAIRAYAYAKLLWYFSPNPMDDNELGTILFTDVPLMNTKLPRNKNGEVYAQIFEDMDYASKNIINRAGVDKKYYVSTDFVNALYAHIYLNKGDYANAGVYAQKVIDQSGLSLTTAKPVPNGTVGSTAWHTSLNAYSTTNPYLMMWNDANIASNEIVFALDRPALIGTGASISSLFNTNESNTTKGNIQYDMGRKLFNLLDARKAYDIRRWAYIDPTSKIIADYATNPQYLTAEVLVIDKYPGKFSGNAPLRNDAKVFRLSDMYLIAAESAAHASNFTKAATMVKAVRDARTFTNATTVLEYTSVQSALADILFERRLDLAFEGHRYLDLKRAGKAAGVAIDRDATDDKFDTPLTLPIDDYRMRSLPIPKNEVQGNQNIQQNPGYNN